MRNCLLLSASLLASLCLAAPTPQETLDQDLAGPRVDWVGVIEQRIELPEGVCFLLTRLRERYPPTLGEKFAACHAGAFDPQRFAPGRELRVTGSLGPTLERQLGAEVITTALVAGTMLKLLPEYHPVPYYACDPYWDPWCDHYGPRWRYWHHR